MKTLEEEELDTEETRAALPGVTRRQYLEIKPEMAWSRAQQAVALLGRPGLPAAVTDQTVRTNAYLTLAEICFLLGSGKRGCPSNWEAGSVCRGERRPFKPAAWDWQLSSVRSGVSIAPHRATTSRPG